MKKHFAVSASDLTDAQVLSEFVKRFNCDGAILIYKDDDMEHGFGEWNNPSGRAWVNNLLKTIQKS